MSAVENYKDYILMQNFTSDCKILNIYKNEMSQICVHILYNIHNNFLA